MGLPEQKRIFVHLIICLTLQISYMTLFLHELHLQAERQSGAFAADDVIMAVIVVAGLFSTSMEVYGLY